MANKQLQVVLTNLQKLLKVKEAALPRNFNQTRFHQNCLYFLQTVPDLEKMEPWSVAYCLLRGALLNLDFANKECYAIPYNRKLDNGQWVTELNFQTDYKGEIKIAKQFSVKPISEIYAKVVREGDVFEELIINGRPSINFRPKPFNSGKILGAFAVCLYQDGSMIYETMSTEEIEHVKEVYAKKNKDGEFSKAWRESPGEMYKKTVIRRLRKLIPIEFENYEQIEADEEGSGFEFKDEIEEIEPIKMPEPIPENSEQSEPAEEQTKKRGRPKKEELQVEEHPLDRKVTEKEIVRLWTIAGKKFKNPVEQQDWIKNEISKFGLVSTKELNKEQYESIIEKLESM